MRERITTGSPVEDIAAYSRAIVDGEWIFVSGTMGVDRATGKLPDVFIEQARNAFAIIEDTLGKAGASLADVVHVRIFVAARDYLPDMVTVLKEKFDAVRPAQTMLIAQMPIEEAKLEVEVMVRRTV